MLGDKIQSFNAIHRSSWVSSRRRCHRKSLRLVVCLHVHLLYLLENLRYSEWFGQKAVLKEIVSVVNWQRELETLTAPAEQATSICSGRAFAEVTMMGKCSVSEPCSSNSRICFVQSMPFSTGISQSIKITSSFLPGRSPPRQYLVVLR